MTALDRTHEPIRREKTGYQYPNGARDSSSAHQLVAFDCSCGRRAAVWYASEDRALGSWQSHVSVQALDRKSRQALDRPVT